MEGLKVIVQVEDDGKNEMYVLTVTDTVTDHSWKLKKSLADYHNLYLGLLEANNTVPVPPGYSRLSSISRFFSSSLPEMQTYTTTLLSDPILSGNQEFLNFLQVYQNLHNARFLHTSLIQEKETRFPVKFIEYSDSFVLTAEVSQNVLHRMEQYMIAIGYAGSSMSLIKCFGEFGMWQLSLTDTVTCFKYNPRLTVLCMGMDDGQLMFMRIKTEKNSEEYENYGKITAHSAPVCGIASDYSNSKVYSCCLNGQLVITSLVDQELFVSINLMSKPKFLVLSAELDTLFLPGKSEVYVYKTYSGNEIKAFDVEFSGYISAICLSRNGFCIVGGYDGEVNVFNSLYILIQKYSVFAGINQIVYNENIKIIAIADSKGNLSLWNSQGKLIVKWKAHKGSLSVCFAENTLYSSGNDYLLKNWSIEGLSSI